MSASPKSTLVAQCSSTSDSVAATPPPVARSVFAWRAIRDKPGSGWQDSKKAKITQPFLSLGLKLKQNTKTTSSRNNFPQAPPPLHAPPFGECRGILRAEVLLPLRDMSRSSKTVPRENESKHPPLISRILKCLLFWKMRFRGSLLGKSTSKNPGMRFNAFSCADPSDLF